MSSSSTSSEEDYCSKNFNPLKALYSKKPKPKPGTYCLFDNLASLEGYLKRTGGSYEDKFDKTKKTVLPKSAPIPKGETVTRRFLPHQQMIHKPRQIKSRQMRSVLTDMETAKGPLARLQVWVTSRTRVKVLIRKNHGIRGFVTGTLRLFDKHWNLVLTDVEEQYQRRKFKSAPELCIESVTENLATLRLKELGLDPKSLTSSSVKVIDKKRVEVNQRHDLLFIRGDQVAVVLEDKSKSIDVPSSSGSRAKR